MAAQIDESLFTKLKNYLCRVLLQQWMLGEIYSGTKEAFLVRFPDRNVETPLPLIQENIHANSTIIFDSWLTNKGQ
jgi:hypothetical protein